MKGAITMNKHFLQQQLAAADHRIKADLVIKNAKIIDVFTLSILSGDVAIHDGKFVGIGEYQGVNEIDANGRYVSPSFIDSHVHIESSMLIPSEFAKVVVPHGVTTVITDPHEIANVSGTAGIDFMIQNSKDLPLEVLVGLPSSVPSTPFENAGAILNAEHLEPFLAEKSVIGLAEVMDYPSVQKGADSMLDKLLMAKKHHAIIDGHGAGLDAHGVNIYATAGIKTDHECVNAQEAMDRLQRGMYVSIRQGSVAKDLLNLLPVVNERTARRCLFCTDDKHLDDLLTEGSVDYNVRLAIEHGLDPLLSIQLASLNVAECYQLQGRGAIAPGYEADFLLLNDLETISIHQVYKSGELVAEEGVLTSLNDQPVLENPALTDTVHVKNLTLDDLRLPVKGNQAHIIEVIPNSLVTNHLVENIQTKNGDFQPSLVDDQLKMLVVERHHETGNIGKGIVKGFRLKEGAIATTIAHDSHNIVAVGTNDEDLLCAIQAIEKMKGGVVIVKNQQVLSGLPLPISGLMSDLPFQDVLVSLNKLHDALHELEIADHFNPLLTLSFLSLPVIPHLKLTDMGLFDFHQFKHIKIDEDLV